MRIFYGEKTIIKTYKLRSRFIGVLLILISLTVLFICYASNVLIPSLNEISDNKISYIMTESVNKAVLEIVKDNDLKYEDLVSVCKDISGNVSNISVNTVILNQLKSEITLSVLNKTNNIDEMYIKFPLIQLFKNSLFRTGFIKIKILCYVAQTLEVDFFNEFKSAGINQTNAIVSVNVKIKYKVITPGSMFNSEVSADVPVAYEVIVGKVPESYVNVESDEKTLKDDVLQLVPN